MTAPGQRHPFTSPAAPALPATGSAALLRLAAPILFAQVAVMAMAVIDTVMAGRLSADDLAAVALGAAVYSSVYVCGIGIMSALMPIAGHHYGAGRHRDIGTDLQQAQWLGLLVSAIGVLILGSCGLWLGKLGASERVSALAHGYLIAIACGLPGALATRGYSALFSALSRPQVMLAIQLAALAGKVPLNYALMYGIGPLPPLGAAGCAVATALLSWLTLGLAWLAWRSLDGFAAFRSQRLHGPTWARQRELLRLGLPSGASLLIEVTSFTFITLLLARLGAATLAANQIVVSIVSVLFMVPLAIGLATSVLVAQALGAGAPRAAATVAWRGVRLAGAAALGLAGATWLGRESIVAAYTTDPQVAAAALALIAAAAAFHLFDALQAVAGFVLRGYKVALLPLLVHATTLWGVGLVGGWWLAYRVGPPWGGAGAWSFWIAAVVGLALAAAALGALAVFVATARIREAAGPQ